MIAVIVVAFHVVGFLSSIHAVMSTRTPQGAIAWVVSLNTFPYLAVPAYWVLGRSRFQGYVTARQAGHTTPCSRWSNRLRHVSSRIGSRTPRWPTHRLAARQSAWQESPT